MPQTGYQQSIFDVSPCGSDGKRKKGSKWVSSHWMSLNGKRDNFTRKDLYSLEKLVPNFTQKRIDKIIDVPKLVGSEPIRA